MSIFSKKVFNILHLSDNNSLQEMNTHLKRNSIAYEHELELDYVSIWANASYWLSTSNAFSFFVITLIFNQFYTQFCDLPKKTSMKWIFHKKRDSQWITMWKDGVILLDFFFTFPWAASCSRDACFLNFFFLIFVLGLKVPLLRSLDVR